MIARSLAGSRPPGAPLVSAAEFRDTVGRFATGITVVTTRDAAGAPCGLTATSFASLSLDPPLVQWSLRTAARSFPIFARAPAFAVSILAADQEAVSRRFSSPEADRFRDIEVTAGLGGLPLIAGAAAWVECARADALPGGDHTIFVGRVLRTRTFARAPLLHWRGAYLAPEHVPIGLDPQSDG